MRCVPADRGSYLQADLLVSASHSIVWDHSLISHLNCYLVSSGATVPFFGVNILLPFVSISPWLSNLLKLLHIEDPYILSIGYMYIQC